MRLALCLVIFLASTPVLASEATDLARKVVAAYGGAEAIERSRSIKQSGTLESVRHGKTGTIERTFSRPDKLRVEIRIPGATPESRILNGERGWHQGKEVPPMMAKAMLLQAARLDLPYLLMKAGERIKNLGPVKAGGHRNFKALEVPMADGLRLIAIVDAKTGFVINSHGLISVAANHTMRFSTAYSNHKQMNGMVVATKESHFVQGKLTGRTVLERSEVVKELPDAVFRP